MLLYKGIGMSSRRMTCQIHAASTAQSATKQWTPSRHWLGFVGEQFQRAWPTLIIVLLTTLLFVCVFDSNGSVGVVAHFYVPGLKGLLQTEEEPCKTGYSEMSPFGRVGKYPSNGSSCLCC